MSDEVMDIPVDWDVTTLGEVNTLRSRTLVPGTFPDEVFEYYSIPDYQNGERPGRVAGRTIASAKLQLKPKSVLFGKLNPRVEKIWRVGALNGLRQIGSTEWIPVLPDARMDPDFLYFLEWSDHVMPKAKTLVSGSTPSRQRVDPTSFYKIRVPLPPLPEQQRIAQVLSTVQEAIAQQERLIRTTTELKQALMQKLFTEGLRGEALKETEIGRVPESWEVQPLAEYCVHTAFGPRFSSDLYASDGNVVTLRTTDMDEYGAIDYSEAPRARLDIEKYTDHIMQVNDVVVSRSGTCGITGVFEGHPLPVLPGAFLLRLRLNEKLAPQYLRHYFNSPVGAPRVQQLAQGAIQKNISGTRLKGLLVPVPRIEEQRAIAESIAQVDRKHLQITRKHSALQDLFRTLLHELMTGKVRVANPEK